MVYSDIVGVSNGHLGLILSPDKYNFISLMPFICPLYSAFWLFQLVLIKLLSLQCKYNTKNWFGTSQRSFLLRLPYGRKYSQLLAQSKSLPCAITIPTPSRIPSTSSSSISSMPMEKLHLRCLPRVMMFSNRWLLISTHQSILFSTKFSNWEI